MSRWLTLFVLASIGAGGCALIDDFSIFSEGPAVDAGRDGGGVDSGGADAGPDARSCGPEVCNGVDDDCDGMTDEEPTECSFPHAIVGCVGGACEMTGCESAFLDCTVEAGCETDPMTEAAHCGGCDDPCAAGQVCDAGACRWPRITEVHVLEGDNAQLRDIVIGAGGALVVAGTATSTATLGGMSTTSTGPLVAQVSVAGTTTWIRNAPVPVSALEAATAGVVYAGGSYSGTLTFAGRMETSSSATFDAVLLSYDPTGGERDVTSFGTSDGDDFLNGLSFRDGRLAVGGTTSGQFVRQMRRGRDDAFVGMSSPGSTPNVTQYGGADIDRITDVALGPAGSYSIVGWYQGTADFGGPTPFPDLGSSPFGSFFVAGYSAAREQTWAVLAAWTNPEGGSPARVQVDADGDTYFAASFMRETDFGAGPVAPTMRIAFAVVGKVSPSGTLLWTRATYADVAGGGLSIGADGHVYLAGSFWSPEAADVFETGDPLPSGAMADCAIASLDANDGSLRWAVSIASLDSVVCYDVVAVDDGVWVLGSFDGTVDFDGDLRTASGVGSDGFLVHIEP